MIEGGCIEDMDRLFAHESILDFEGRVVCAAEKETAFLWNKLNPP
jgi:hypothetical protein